MTDHITAEWTDETETEDVQVSHDDSPGPADDDQVEHDVPPETEDDGEDDPETFPLAYVQKLRQEAADARVKAKRADDYAAALFVERVKATGKLADATDLPYTPDLLDDPEALTAAIDNLLAAKPHLMARRPFGNVGQGTTGAVETVDLAAMLRAGA